MAINTAKQLLALEDRAWMGFEGIFFDGEQLARLLNLDLSGGLLRQGRLARRLHPVRIMGQDILLGGDLIIEFGTQETCHSECLARARKNLAGLTRMKSLREGKIIETPIDVSATRRNFLKE